MIFPDMITAETRAAHKATWYVYSAGQKLRRVATMRGSWDGYDVECSCGWTSATGGAIKVRVQESLDDHRFDAQAEAELHAEAREAGVDPTDLSAYSRWLRGKLGILR